MKTIYWIFIYLTTGRLFHITYSQSRSLISSILRDFTPYQTTIFISLPPSKNYNLEISMIKRLPGKIFHLKSSNETNYLFSLNNSNLD